MTVRSAVTSTYGEMFTELRDELTSMTNWSVFHDTTASSMPAQGETIVLETPNGELIEWYFGDEEGFGEDLVLWKHGEAYDATNEVWDDRYPRDPDNWMYGQGSHGMHVRSGGSSNDPSYDEGVQYWLHYAEGSGFFLYAERTVGDGEDTAFIMSMAKANKLWDYSTAASRESDYAVFLKCTANYHADGSASYWNDYSINNEEVDILFSCGGESSDSNLVVGRPNGDSNFNNYPA
jgi:hypothetical protein